MVTDSLPASSLEKARNSCSLLEKTEPVSSNRGGGVMKILKSLVKNYFASLQGRAVTNGLTSENLKALTVKSVNFWNC